MKLIYTQIMLSDRLRPWRLVVRKKGKLKEAFSFFGQTLEWLCCPLTFIIIPPEWRELLSINLLNIPTQVLAQEDYSQNPPLWFDLKLWFSLDDLAFNICSSYECIAHKILGFPPPPPSCVKLHTAVFWRNYHCCSWAYRCISSRKATRSISS